MTAASEPPLSDPSSSAGPDGVIDQHPLMPGAAAPADPWAAPVDHGPPTSPHGWLSADDPSTWPTLGVPDTVGPNIGQWARTPPQPGPTD